MTLTDAVRACAIALFLAGTAHPAVAADEQCVARCDQESDRCMAKADTEEKAQKCDDEYSKCLEKCR